MAYPGAEGCYLIRRYYLIRPYYLVRPFLRYVGNTDYAGAVQAIQAIQAIRVIRVIRAIRATGIRANMLCCRPSHSGQTQHCILLPGPAIKSTG